MQHAFKVAGRMADPRHIELDVPLNDVHGRVEVLVRVEASPPSSPPDVFELIATFPPGIRSKEEIDAELDADRSAWDVRQ